MKRIFTTCISALLIISQANGQQPSTGFVSGTVTEASGVPVPFASVTVLKASDSSLVRGDDCSQDGKFRISGLAQGKYILAASELGFLRALSNPFEVSASHQGATGVVLVLKDKAQVLHGVSVSALKPLIEHQIDKIVVNVEGSIVSAGSTAYEILQKSPGVTIDNNDVISLDGKSGVTIMIDGKPTYLSQQQLTNVLKSMNSSTISKIELMNHPSAKYDAAGTAGIINIITKKSKMTGWNGSLNAGITQGIHERQNLGANLNYRNGKFNFYGNYDFSHQIWSNNNYITRNFYDGPAGTLSSRFEQTSKMAFPNFNHDFKAGVDYFLSQNQTLGVMVSGTFNPSSSFNSTGSNLLSPGGALQSIALTDNSSTGQWSNLTYDMNYQGKFDTVGNELDVDVAHSIFDNRTMQDFLTDTYDSTGTLEKGPGLLNPNIRKGSLPSLIGINTIKLDFTHPMKGNAKLEFGIKSSLVSSDNNVQYFYLNNGVWMYDSATNHFKYTENINAGYLNFTKQFSHGFSIQLGLRGEQTVSRGQQFTTDSIVNRNYFQLFPSIFLNQALDKNNTLTLSYSRRVDRPDYQDLNPFRYYLDPYTYQVGNPFLQPQLTNSIELGHSYKGILNTTINFSRTTNVMTDVLNQIDSAKITYQTRDNLASLTSVTASLSANIAVTPWWMTNDYISAYYNDYKGVYLGGNLNYARISWNFNSTNTFTLPRHYALELSGYYNGPMVEGFLIGLPQYQVSMGIQKSIWNQKGTLKLNINDVFNTNHFMGYVKYQNIDVTINSHYDSRRVSVSFSYNFSKGASSPNRNHSSSIEEEQDRIKH